jgi:ATP-dependent Lon protease
LLTIESVSLRARQHQPQASWALMNESIAAALSWCSRSRAAWHRSDFYQKTNLHVHLPEGARHRKTAVGQVLRSSPHRFDFVRHTGARRMLR